ncbi:DUF1015 domain-containing protein [Magnetococcales bacterium HHB-1]
MNKSSAMIQPFPGWRPAPDHVEQISAPPYDVLNREEARQIIQDNPESFLKISKADATLPDTIDAYDLKVYQQAKRHYEEMKSTGALIQDEKPCYYLYQLTWQGKTQTGVVVAASVDAYMENRIRKHEFTRPDKENDRTTFAQTLGAHSGPVFLTFRHTQKILDLIKTWAEDHAPIYDFTTPDTIKHRFWVVDQQQHIDALTEAFDELPELFVADGHHRSAAASRLCEARRKEYKAQGQPITGEEPFNRFLSVLFPDNEMRILDYNRVVRDLNGLSREDFLKSLKESFVVTPVDRPMKPKMGRQFGLYLPNQWYQLSLKSEIKETDDPVARLDVSLLSQYILEPILNITDLRRDPRIDFVGGMRGMEGLMARVDSGEMAAAFSLYATSLDDLMSVASAGQVMPPKSTWFEPKLRDGLVIQEV